MSDRRFYSEKERQRPPLSEQKEFRSIKNAVIYEAENIRLGQITFEDKDAEAVADQDATDISSLPYDCWKLWIVADDDTAPMVERDAAAAQLIEKAESGDLHAQYLTGKLYQDGPVLIPDSVEALYWFEQAAKQGHSAAQYAAGKILLPPDPEVHDPELEIQWLESAVQNKNGYAAYWLGMVLDSFIAGFRLACGICSELGKNNWYSFVGDVEQRLREPLDERREP